MAESKDTRSTGKPVMNRSQRRMFEYNTRKAGASGDWNNMVTVEQYPQNMPPPRPGKPSTRSKAWKSKQTARPPPLQDPAEVRGPVVAKAKTENLIDEPLWTFGVYSGTQPERQTNQQNLDFSTFPLLCERTYVNLEKINPRIRREMPFCMFQHVMTSALNAYLIHHVGFVNMENRFANEESPLNLFPDDFIIPSDIAEYLRSIANIVTPQGSLVRVNVPDIGIPQMALPAVDAVPALPSGTFGAVTPENHNAYECYVSPYITSELVSQTFAQNMARRFEAWNPLPVGSFPAGTVPNENLLGYRAQVEMLNPEELQSIAEPGYVVDDCMAGRLRISSDFNARVSGTLKRMEDQYRMTVGIPTNASNSAALGWIRVEALPGLSATRNTTRLSTVMGSIRSPIALGSSQTNIVGVFGLKRERTNGARGLCYTAPNGNAPVNWNETINNNFAMVGPFAQTVGFNLGSLRESQHCNASPVGNRGDIITSWTRRNFVIEKKYTTRGILHCFCIY
ncbi:hypothetical protein M0802_010638 [Mischocyttarus mexicanus]|nr:hypothetical protein M0802_010638 [Mischocyttarus mexicanus]